MTRFGFLSSYPPTRCGLATFTESLASAIVEHAGNDARIVRVLDEPRTPSEGRFGSLPVVAELVGGDSASLQTSVRTLNGFDVVVVQHEYGIYGGTDGAEVITVLEGLTTPSIVVLHTVLEAPTAGQKAVLERIAELATSIVVMTATAHEVLGRRYAVSMAKARVIPHGVAGRFGALAPKREPGRRVLTWGLIGPGKGLEWGIRAMAELTDLDPLPEYVIAGKTHPKVLLHEGETYRNHLIAIVAELDLGERVRFIDAYPDGEELAALVAEADIVLLPYDTRTQVTSGVLVEAVTAGKPVVSTGFPHAIELLSTGAGIVVDHESPLAIAVALRSIFGESGRAERMMTAAQDLSREHNWLDVAKQYHRLSRRLLSVRAA